MAELPDSDASLVLLHNPRCSKSRAARALLEERGVAFAERRYLDDPLTLVELYELAARLGRPPREWSRRGEEAWSGAQLADDADDDATWKGQTTTINGHALFEPVVRDGVPTQIADIQSRARRTE